MGKLPCTLREAKGWGDPHCDMPSADKLYRKILTSALVKSKFFSRGWGDVDTYRALLQLREAITSRREGNLIISSCPTNVSLKKVRVVNVEG